MKERSSWHPGSRPEFHMHRGAHDIGLHRRMKSYACACMFLVVYCLPSMSFCASPSTNRTAELTARAEQLMIDVKAQHQYRYDSVKAYIDLMLAELRTNDLADLDGIEERLNLLEIALKPLPYEYGPRTPEQVLVPPQVPVPPLLYFCGTVLVVLFAWIAVRIRQHFRTDRKEK